MRDHTTLKTPSLDWLADHGPKALAAYKVRPVIGAFLTIGLALYLYRSQPDIGFAVLSVLGVAAGWLVLGRVAGLICAGAVVALVGTPWLRILPWWVALIQVAIVITLTGLAHLAAEGSLRERRHTTTEERLRGMTFLLETIEFLGGTRDRDVILNTAVRAAAHGISRPGHGRLCHAGFHEVAGDRATIVMVADEPAEQDLARGFEYLIERNQAARAAIRTGRPALVRPDHLAGDLRALAEQLGWQVLIMAPVYRAGSLHGLLAATARDGPAVTNLQQFMLGTLARFTSASLDSIRARSDSLSAEEKRGADESAMQGLLPGVVDELRVAVKPIKNRILELRASKNGTDPRSEELSDALGKLDDLISTLASRTAIDATTGVLNREFGLAALERDVLRARRSQASRHCVAVVRMGTLQESRGSELTRLVADRLRSRLRREDLIFRYSADEFVCSFADMDAADVQAILGRIQTELAAEIGYAPFSIGLTPVSQPMGFEGNVTVNETQAAEHTTGLAG